MGAGDANILLMATGNPGRKPVEFGSDYPIIYEVFFTIQMVVGNGISAINSTNKCNQNLATPRGNSVFFTSFFFFAEGQPIKSAAPGV